MPQCEATRIGRPDRGDEPRQCRRNAVKGTKFCQAHGGSEDANRLPTKPDKRTHNSVRCVATSRRTGERCQRMAIIGTTVCRHHGGKSPQVLKAARQRMEDMVGPALQQLQAILEKPNTSDTDRLRAIALLLDRTGFGPTKNVGVDVNVKKYEHVVTQIIREAPDEDLSTSEVIPGEIVTDEVEGSTGASGDPDPEVAWEPEPDPDLAPIYLLRSTAGQANPPSHQR